MAKTIEDLFFYLVFVFDFLFIAQVLVANKAVRLNQTIWLLAIYCSINSLTNFICAYTSYDIDYYAYGMFTLIEYGIFSAFIFYNLQNKLHKKIILLLSVSFVIYSAYHTFFSKPKGLDSIPIGIETILLFLYCFFYLFSQMNIIDEKEIFIYRKHQFWVIIGIMLYLGGSFFIYILANNISRDILDQYWFLTYVFYILKNIFFAIALSYYKVKNKKPSYNKLQPYLN